MEEEIEEIDEPTEEPEVNEVPIEEPDEPIENKPKRNSNSAKKAYKYTLFHDIKEYLEYEQYILENYVPRIMKAAKEGKFRLVITTGGNRKEHKSKMFVKWLKKNGYKIIAAGTNQVTFSWENGGTKFPIC